MEEEGICLTSGGDMGSKLERKERKGLIITGDHLYGHGEDTEEDKRE